MHMPIISTQLYFISVMIFTQLLICVGTIATCILFTTIYCKRVVAPTIESRLDETPTVEVEEVEEVEVGYNAYMTNYYTGSDGTTSRTGSGLKTSDFKINELGWYTYNNKVVVATATYQGLASSYGVLERYNEALDGITYYNYFDTLTLTYDGVEYDCIVLDTCGSSMELQESDKGLQRIDVFIANKKYAFGKELVYVQ